jgi:hypothetical protein
MFAIKLTLVTILSATIVTQNFAAAADTIQSLVHYHAITFVQICYRASDLLDYTSYLMT